jgi:hypothetical protein
MARRSDAGSGRFIPETGHAGGAVSRRKRKRLTITGEPPELIGRAIAGMGIGTASGRGGTSETGRRHCERVNDPRTAVSRYMDRSGDQRRNSERL